jgi:phosphohistidine phosphatase
MRHAKSSWDDPALDDRDRPLAPRGRQAAPRMGRLLADRGWRPQRVLVSPAMRTRETWELVAAELGLAPEPEFLEALYMGNPAKLLALIRNIPDDVQSAMLVGHNPGLETLASRLAGGESDKTATGSMRAKFPTAALAVFALDGSWKRLDFGSARLTHFIRPRDLE